MENLHFNLEIEEIILGSLIIERAAYPEAKRFLKAEMFDDTKHQEIFKAIEDLHEQGTGIDIMTVTERLRSRGTLEDIGGPYKIVTMSGKVASTVHLEFHCRILLDSYQRRRLILELNKSLSKAMDPTYDLMDTLMELQSILTGIMDISPLLSNLKDMPKVIEKIIEESVDRSTKSEEGITGIPTGIMDLNRMTFGWQNGDLIIIGGRPSDGKTALALKFALEAAKADYKVVVFSLEMSAERLGDRWMLSESGIPPISWKLGKLTEEESVKVTEASERLRTLPIKIDDSPNLTMEEICYTAKSLHTKGECNLVIIDYLQICKLHAPGRTREQEVAACSAKAKMLARQLNCPVILLSQLNRDPEGRSMSLPRLSDLRDSGSIEQDADVVGLLYRPDKVGIMTDKESGYPTEGLGILLVAKQRNGETGKVYFGHDKAMVHIGDYMPPEAYLQNLSRKTK